MRTLLGNRLLSALFASAALAATAGFAEAKTVIHVMHQGDPGWVKAYGDVAGWTGLIDFKVALVIAQVVGYALSTEVIKRIYVKRYGEWL